MGSFLVLFLALLSIAFDFYLALNSKYIFITVICVIAALFALFVVIDTIGDTVEKYILWASGTENYFGTVTSAIGFVIDRVVPTIVIDGKIGSDEVNDIESIFNQLRLLKDEITEKLMQYKTLLL